jgi:uncharacterized membrane protein YhfC
VDARRRQVRKCSGAPARNTVVGTAGVWSGSDVSLSMLAADSIRCSAANIPHLRASASAICVCAHNLFCTPAVWATFCSCFSRLVALLVCTALSSVVCSGVRAPQTHTHTHTRTNTHTHTNTPALGPTVPAFLPQTWIINVLLIGY